MTPTKRTLLQSLCFLALSIGGVSLREVDASEIDTTLNTQYRYFVNSSPWVDTQKYPSVSLESEWKHDLSADGHSVTITPFFRYDAEDEDRRYSDLREAHWTWQMESGQFNAGITRVSWGVMEFFKLVDVINQKDARAFPDREKLGQPLLSYSTDVYDTLVDLYLLQGLREVDFAGDNARFRYSIPVDQDNAEYEWGATQKTDMAIRVKKTWGDWDIAFSHFYGMNRNPTLVFNFDFTDPRLIPVYEKINQSSVDIVGEFNGILLKTEMLFQTGDIERYGAATVGAEYTFTGVASTQSDLTTLVEATYDSREYTYQMPYDRDVFVGARFAFNDAHDQSLLLGVVQDIDYRQQTVLTQWTANVGEQWKLRLAASAFQSAEPLPDRAPSDRAILAAYAAVESGELPLDVALVRELLGLAENRRLNPRDLTHFLAFLQQDDALRRLRETPAQHVADTFYDVLLLSSPAQKMHWAEQDDFVQFDLYYYF